MIGPINLPVGRLFVEEVITECRKRGASRVDLLAFEFEMGLFPAALAEAIKAGDGQAMEVWDRSVYLLACGIGSLINVLDPAMILLGGGIAELGELLFKPLQRHLDEVEWRPGGISVLIRQAQLGEWAGAYGAAKFALQKR